jgi:hypothetical protein
MSKLVVSRALSRALALSAVACYVVTLIGVASSAAADMSLPAFVVDPFKNSVQSAPIPLTPVPKTAPRTKTTAKALAVALPDPSLLTPQLAPDCAFKGIMSSTITAEETREKLDYEAQCYRQAETIVRARLEALQEAVGKMLKKTAQRDAVVSIN